MSTKTDEAGAPAPAELRAIPIAAITIEADHNPRQEVDPDAQAALCASIKKDGVLQPLLVRPAGDDGRYVLVAGHRRLAAASSAGLDAVPALVVRVADIPAERAVLALAENVLRQELNPIEEARALERIRAARGYRSQAALAARLGLAPGWVGERLRLLRLPERCQEAVAAGIIPLRACASLERIARVSGQVAEACCALIEARAASSAQLEQDPAALARLVARAQWSGERPCCVAVSGYGSLPVKDLPLPEARAEELAARAEACGTSWVALDDDDADAARAFGCLLEFPAASDRYARERFVCSAEFLADRVALKLERAEERVHSAQARADATTGHMDVPAAADDAAAATERAAERERARLERGRAQRGNAELGLRLAEAYAAPVVSADMARLVALIVFDRLGRQLGPDGLRLCAPGWQETETRTLKSGEVRERTRYPERRDAEARARAFIAEARTPEEIIGRTLQAIIAASYADQQAVPVAERGTSSGAATFGGGEIARLVALLAREHVPERLARRAREGAHAAGGADAEGAGHQAATGTVTRRGDDREAPGAHDDAPAEATDDAPAAARWQAWRGQRTRAAGAGAGADDVLAA